MVMVREASRPAADPEKEPYFRSYPNRRYNKAQHSFYEGETSPEPEKQCCSHRKWLFHIEICSFPWQLTENYESLFYHELCITFVIFAIETPFLYQITTKLQCYYCKNPVISNYYFTRDLNVKSIKI